MSDREHHCPFLNRADHRCSGFFSIQGMQHAFEHCFDAYKACGVYQELLAERQSRREQGAPGAGTRFLWATACKSPEAAADVSRASATSTPAPANAAASTVKATVAAGPRTQFVQLRLPTGLAAVAAVSAALATAAAAA